MTDPKHATPEETAAWQRHFAVAAFNRSWDLLDARAAGQGSEGTDDELLALVFASRWHWGAVGTTENHALGDHQIAKAASAVGLGELALRFAARALATAEAEGWEGWRRAAMYEGMARACEAAGEAADRDTWLSRARAALATIPDPEDREVVEAQLREIPGWDQG